MHLGIPPALWTSFCPFRVLRDPVVYQWLLLFGRFQRYGTLPTEGGIDDQDERTMKALDVMSRALELPVVPIDRKG